MTLNIVEYKNKDEFYKSVDDEYGLDITPSHQQYINAIENNTLVICVGPAGTGKTLFAAKSALEMLKSKKIDKIIVTRPAIEAEKGLGHLPGTLEEKFRALC